MKKIIHAEKNVPGMTKVEIDSFLGGGRLILRLGTLDLKGDPAIHPVWYYYADDHLYLFSGPNARKVQNMQKNNRVYFTVDTDAAPNKGVRGKGTARLITEPAKTIHWAEKIVDKYMDRSSPGYKGMMDYARSGKSTVVEITPQYYTVWDYTKVF